MFKGTEFYTSKNKVKNLAEYIAQIDYALRYIFNGNAVWYRGHANDDYKLIPNIFRSNFHNQSSEKLLKEDFKDKAKGLVKSNELDEYEWYFLMQHYGLKTRLLDWTEGYLIALFFSLKLNQTDNKFKDPCVWMMNPLKLNEISIKEKKLIRTDMKDEDYNLFSKEYLLKCYDKPKKPIAISSTYSNERILRQKGCFTLHGGIKKDILSFYRTAKCNEMVKILINRKSADFILEQLVQAGISESSIFPDLEGLSRELNKKYNY